MASSPLTLAKIFSSHLFLLPPNETHCSHQVRLTAPIKWDSLLPPNETHFSHQMRLRLNTVYFCTNPFMSVLLLLLLLCSLYDMETDKIWVKMRAAISMKTWMLWKDPVKGSVYFYIFLLSCTHLSSEISELLPRWSHGAYSETKAVPRAFFSSFYVANSYLT